MDDGAGFTENERITVRIARRVLWSGVIRAQARQEVENEKFIDKSIKLVPYLYIGLKTVASIEGWVIAFTDLIQLFS